jgi:hypothetical protein
MMADIPVFDIFDEEAIEELCLLVGIDAAKLASSCVELPDGSVRIKPDALAHISEDNKEAVQEALVLLLRSHQMLWSVVNAICSLVVSMPTYAKPTDVAVTKQAVIAIMEPFVSAQDESEEEKGAEMAGNLILISSQKKPN